MAQPAFFLHVTRFDALLADRKLTRKRFADLAHLPYSTVRKAREGTSDVNMHTVGRMLDFFPGVSFDYLFTRNADAVIPVDEYADLQAVA
jgi:hypothetical protein